jgi:hypothetical protein
MVLLRILLFILYLYQQDYNEKIQEIMEEFDHAVDIACNVDAFIEQDDSTVRCDKETNTMSQDVGKVRC